MCKKALREIKAEFSTSVPSDSGVFMERDSNSLKRHISKVHEQRDREKLQCNLCDKSFLWPMSLKYHNKVVHEHSRKYICDCYDINIFDYKNTCLVKKLHVWYKKYVFDQEDKCLVIEILV